MKAQTSPTPAQLAQIQAAADAQFDWNKLLNDAKEKVGGLLKAQTSPSAAQLAQTQAANVDWEAMA